jgi:hypothetical protein
LQSNPPELELVAPDELQPELELVAPDELQPEELEELLYPEEPDVELLVEPDELAPDELVVSPDELVFSPPAVSTRPPHPTAAAITNRTSASH